MNPKETLLDLFSCAVAAAQAELTIGRYLPPPPKGRLIVLGAGKAAGAMAQATEHGYQRSLEGVVIVPDGYARPCKLIRVAEASHPIPDVRGLAAASEILRLAQTASDDDLVLCLISGGASALMVAPASGVELGEKRAITAALLRSGASIAEINCVRKHLSAIKGGRLAAAAAPAAVVSLIVSDVVGDDPAVIASGPTVPDPTTCADALKILTSYNIPHSARIAGGLREDFFETPKHLVDSAVQIIARPKESLAAAAAFARSLGFAVHDLGDARVGEAREEAKYQADLVRSIRAGAGPVQAPCAIISGGELVVTVNGSGRGGPNTEFALALALACEDVPGVFVLAADTDGRDGASGAAGALTFPGLITSARRNRLNPEDALRGHDSGSFFAACDALVDPGPTFTNVNDFRAVLVLP